MSDAFASARPLSSGDVSVLLVRLLELDREIDRPLDLLLGGSAALALAFGLKVSTRAIEAIPMPTQHAPGDLVRHVARVAARLGLDPTWIDGTFASLLDALPADYPDRLVQVLEGKRLRAWSLGADELSILRLFAGRPDDLAAVRSLLAKGANAPRIETHLRSLADRGLLGATRAAERFRELREDLGV